MKRVLQADTKRMTSLGYGGHDSRKLRGDRPIWVSLLEGGGQREVCVTELRPGYAYNLEGHPTEFAFLYFSEAKVVYTDYEVKGTANMCLILVDAQCMRRALAILESPCCGLEERKIIEYPLPASLYSLYEARSACKAHPAQEVQELDLAPLLPDVALISGARSRDTRASVTMSQSYLATLATVVRPYPESTPRLRTHTLFRLVVLC